MLLVFWSGFVSVGFSRDVNACEMEKGRSLGALWSRVPIASIDSYLYSPRFLE